ncbi:hypothetical protein [Cryptosporangium aurantiacum]|uniref:PPE family protein n=1 Tax=Cryptosporangium aurantiacum TaxID=134849 RepID=A0A1M7TXN3_9ACTN|nr:hypothetical protein [Cryptosporangium aurantiacum]SHN75461.1 hypothetical protein SAMN05443668_107302 [Cryptosporangium aurantiacum]
MGDEYYGYDAADNDKLIELRHLGRRTGDNLTEYGDSSVGSDYFTDYEQTYKPTGKPTETMSQEGYDYFNKTDGYGRTGASGSGIEAIYKRIMAQNPGKVQALIDHWYGIAEALRSVMAEVKTKSDDVHKHWTSPGATQFLTLGPGAALKSLNDWQMAAAQTSMMLQLVLHDLQAKQTEIQTLYKQYTDEVATWHKEIELKGPEEVKNAEDLYAKHIADIHQKYTYPAQVIESKLADAYWDGYNGVVSSTPGVYEGPTNAVVAPPPLGMPNMPGLPGAGPGAPTAIPPGLAPPTPVNPMTAKPAPPTPPVAPGKGGLAPIGPLNPVNAGPPPPVAPGKIVPPVVPPVAPTLGVPPPTILPPSIAKGGPALPPGAPPAPAPPPNVRPPVAPPAPTAPTSPVAKSLVKGVLKPGGTPGNPNLPPMPGRARPNATPPVPPGMRPGSDRQSRLARPVLGGSGPGGGPNTPPPMPGGGRRPDAPGGPGGMRAIRPGGPGGPGGSAGLPPSPFAGPRPPGPSVLGGRTGRPGDPGIPGVGRTQQPPGALPPPGATRPVLDRRAEAPPPPPPGRQAAQRPNLFRPQPGSLPSPWGPSPLTRPAAPVLNQAVGHRPGATAPMGVPDALRGTAPGATDRPTDATRPVTPADLAARHHADAVAPVPVDQSLAADAPVVRDEDVFAPVTPGGPVLAQGSTPPEYRTEERVALPGSGQ